MIATLLWKESREQFWKSVILGITALSCIGAGYVLQLRAQAGFLRDAPPAEWEAACLFIMAVISPIWIASGFTAAERRAGSFDVLLALPARHSLFFAVKALVGLFAYVLPLILAWILQRLLNHQPMGDISSFAEVLAVSVAVYFLMLTVTASTRSESRAAMIGVLALLVCVIWASFLSLIMPHRFEPPAFYWLIPNPFMLTVTNDPRGPSTRNFDIQLLILLFWAAAALWRFLRTASNTGTGTQEQPLPLTRTLLRPLAQPPLIWKEVREQFSVFAIAFWTAVGVALLLVLVEITDSFKAGFGARGSLLDMYGAMLQVMLIAGLVMPLLISVVLGVGAFAGDLDQRLLHFWRGQPIPIGPWFWTKYFVSATGIFLLLVVPLSFAAGGVTILEGGSDISRFRQTAWLEFLAVIVIVPFAHALSIFFASLIRHTMYATIITVLILIVVAAAPLFDGTNLIQLLADRELPSLCTLYLFCGSALLAVLLLSVARHILANDTRLA